MCEYQMIPATKKRLKLTVESIPYMKKKRIRRKSYEEIEFERAQAAKRAIMTDKQIVANNIRIKKAKDVFDNKNFQIIKDAGANIRKRELVYYLYFAYVFVIFALISGLAAFLLDLPILFLAIIPIFFICKEIIKPKVRFKDLFLKIYLPVCYFCANIRNEDDTLSFDIADKYRNWDRKTANHRIITNSFKVKMKKYTANIQRMIIRDWISTYKIVDGKMEIGRKLATIFSGYSFEMKFSPLSDKYPENDLVMAIINKNTFAGTDGLYEEDSSTLKLKRLNFRFLEDDWQVYIKEDFDIDNKTLKEIEKKIIMISNEVCPFNAYITQGAARMMLNIHSDRRGFKEEFLHAQLKNPEALTYEGFYSIIKTLCVTGYMNKLVRILFNVKEDKIHAEKNEPKRIKKKKPKFLTEEEILNKKNNEALVDNSKPEFSDENKKKRILFHKKGDTSIDTALGLVLSVILGALLLIGLIPLLNKNMAENTISKTESVYIETERPSTVTESMLIQ